MGLFLLQIHSRTTGYKNNKQKLRHIFFDETDISFFNSFSININSKNCMKLLCQVDSSLSGSGNWNPVCRVNTSSL